MGEFVKYGLIGVGVGAEFATKGLKLIEDKNIAKIVAVTSAHEHRVKAFAEKYGIEKWFTDYRKMLREDIDAVIISTPHYLHFPMTIDALEAGKHVLVDKPMAINLNQVDEMIRRAEKYGLKLGVIFQSRFDERVRKIKNAVDSGEFGKIIMGEAVVEWFRTQEYYDKSVWRGRWSTEGGGALINQAIHTIDLLVWIMGEVDELWALTNTIGHNIEVEDLAVAMIKFKNGAFGVIQGSTAIYPGLPTRLEIHGLKGTAILEGEVLKLFAVEGKESYSETEEKKGLKSWARPEAVPPINHSRVIEDFTRAILEDRKPFIDGYEGRRSLEVIRAIYKSGLTGEKIKFPYREQ